MAVPSCTLCPASPIRSTAYTRWSRASAPTTPNQDADVAPWPCISTSGGPPSGPLTCTWVRPNSERSSTPCTGTGQRSSTRR